VTTVTSRSDAGATPTILALRVLLLGVPGSRRRRFKLTPYNGYWIQTTLQDFTRGADGGTSYSNVVMDARGNLYGTASRGGDDADCPGGCGVVWEITP
jgi:hypothetical protein